MNLKYVETLLTMSSGILADEALRHHDTLQQRLGRSHRIEAFRHIRGVRSWRTTTLAADTDRKTSRRHRHHHLQRGNATGPSLANNSGLASEGMEVWTV